MEVFKKVFEKISKIARVVLGWVKWNILEICAVIIVLCGLGFFLNYAVDFNRRLNEVQTGKKFRIESPDRNPYKESEIYEGTIIDRNGDYILYTKENGDTSSINFRVFFDCGEFKIID